MGGININTGGGGLVIGDGGVAAGVGSTVMVQAKASDMQLSKEQLSSLLTTLGALKAALVGGDVDNGATWATRVGELEHDVLGNGGRLAAEPARRLLAKIRYAGRESGSVSAALANTAALVRRRDTAADVFVSYKREDRARIEPIVTGLRDLAIDVWIDEALTPGGSFTDEICEEIDLCRAQIVCWSGAAAASDWVRGEAEIGRRRGVLICVQLEPVQLRPPFNMTHVEDMSSWSGDQRHPGWRKVLTTLSVSLGRGGLADLAEARAGGEAALAAWKRRYPNDPYAMSAQHG